MYKEVDSSNSVTLSHSQYSATKLVNQPKDTNAYVHKVYWLNEEGNYVDVTNNSSYCTIPTNGTGSSAVPSIDFTFNFLKDGMYAVYTYNNKGIGYNAPGSWCLVNCNVAESIDTARLEELGTLVSTIGKDYYQSNDRWNGNLYCENGFWVTYMAEAYEEALRVLQNPLSNQSITDSLDVLNNNRVYLILNSQLNPTLLYETIQAEKNRNLKASDYTALSWKAYSDAKADAEAYLASLFTTDAQGNIVATDENKAENQTKADSKATALTAAYEALYSQSLYEQTQAEMPVLKSEAAVLFQKIKMDGLRQGDYTTDSWTAFESAFAAAEEAYEKEYAFTGASSERNDLIDYRRVFSDLYKAWLLLEQTGEIRVTLTVNDLFGIDYSECLLTDPATATFSGSKTLSDGQHSIRDLYNTLDWSGVTSHQLKYSGFETNIAQTYLIYINGVLVRNPFTKQLPASSSSGYIDTLGAAQPVHDKLQLHNGDEVVFLRVSQPNKTYYSQLEPVQDINLVLQCFNLLRFTTDPATLSPKEGESFTLNLEEQKAYWSTYDGRLRAAVGKEIIAYGPMNEDGTYPAEPIRTGCVTDAEGKVNVTLNQAGTYVLIAMDTSGMDFENKVYPGLTGGAHLTVTVSSVSSSELAAKKAELSEALDALLEESNESDYDAAAWTDLQAIIADGKSAIENAASMQSVQDAYDQAVSDFRAVSPIDHESILSRFAHYLKYLPGVEQISQYFSKLDRERMGWIMALYDSMSDYQKEMLSPSQQAQYNALVAAYGEDGSGLPEFEAFNVTIDVDDSNLIYDSTSSQFRAVYYDREENRNTIQTAWVSFNRAQIASGYVPEIEVQSGSHKPDAIELIVNISKEYYDLLEEIEIVGAEVDSYTIEDVPSGFYRYTYYILIPYQDFSIHIKTEQSPLQQFKNAALTVMENKLNSYNKDDYTAENWEALTAAYSAGVAAIKAAANEDDVTAAKQTALDEMDAVKTKSETGVLGSVKVIVENTTKTDAVLKNTIINTTVNLESDSTMMKCILTALESEGYSWTGTGGKGYGITYLSSIYIDANNNGVPDDDEKSLAEFDGGPQSGWMGTLNDWFVSEGFASFTVASGKLKDGDEIRVQYTKKGYGTDLGATWANNDTSLKAITVDGGSIAPTFVDPGILEYVLTPEGGSVSLLPTAANKNFQVRIFLNQQNKNADAEYYRRGESIPVKSGDVIWIGVGEKAWASMNDGSITGTWYKLHVVGKDDANAVVKLINAIGSVTYSNYETKQNAVDLARAAYDALNPAAQSSVTYYTTLTKAEAAIKGYLKVGKLKEAIAALPKNITEADREAVEEAEDLYNELAQDAPDLLNLLKGTETNKLQKAINTLKLIDALKKVSEIDFVSTKANTVAAVIGALEDELGGMKIDGKAVTVVVTLEEKDFTAADETGDGSYTASVSFTLGSGSQAAKQQKTISGTIKRSDDNGVQIIKVSGVPAEPVSGKDAEYTATLPYGSDPAAATFEIVPAAKATVSVQPAATGTDGKTWTFTVKAENGDTKQYTVTLSVSSVKVTVLDSWVYYVSDDTQPVKLDPSAVTGLMEAVNPDKLGLAIGTEEAFLWLEVREKTGDKVYTVTPVFAADGGESTAVPAAALSGKIGLTLPVPGTEYARVVFGGEYLDATGSASGITFEVAEAGDYTLIPDAHVAAVAFHLCGGNSDDVTDGEKVIFYREDLTNDLPRAVKSGSSFVGWNSKEDGSGKTYAKVSADLPADLYAVWWTEPQEIEVNKIVDESKVTVDAVVNDEGEAVITVYSEEPCVAIVKIGDEYKRLSAVRNEDGSYSFTQEDYDESMEFFVLLKGDTNGDGEIDISDFSKAKAASLRKKTLEELGVTELGILATDLDGEDGVDAGDIAKLKAAYLHKTTLNWDEDE